MIFNAFRLTKWKDKFIIKSMLLNLLGFLSFSDIPFPFFPQAIFLNCNIQLSPADALPPPSSANVIGIETVTSGGFMYSFCVPWKV